MDSFTVRDLRERPGEIIREAERGHLSCNKKRSPRFPRGSFSGKSF